MHPVTSSTEPPNQSDRKLPDLHEGDGEVGDEPITVTGVRGTVARFAMSYEPPTNERVKFGPPLKMRVGSFVYMAIALAILGLVVWGYNAPSTSRIFRWIVEGDRTRPLGSQVLAAIVMVSALATVARAHMRGVVLSPDWIESRYLLPLGIPKASRWGWAQVSRIIFDKDSIALELIDGSWQRLAEVADSDRLRKCLLGHATERHIDVTELTSIKR